MKLILTFASCVGLLASELPNGFFAPMEVTSAVEPPAFSVSLLSRVRFCNLLVIPSSRYA